MITFEGPTWLWDRNGALRDVIEDPPLVGGAAPRSSDLARHLLVIAASRVGGLTGCRRGAEDFYEVSLFISDGSGELIALSWTGADAYEVPPRIIGDGAALDLQTEVDVEWLVKEVRHELSIALSALIDDESTVLAALVSENESIAADDSWWSRFANSPAPARTKVFADLIEEHGREGFDEDLAEAFNLEMDELGDLDDDEVCLWLNNAIDSLKAKLSARAPDVIGDLANHFSGAEAELFKWNASEPLTSFAWVESQDPAELQEVIAASPDWTQALAAAVLGGSRP